MKTADRSWADVLHRLEPFAFYTILALWLVPVWGLDFFVTGDGPCHLYNSKILLDWWQGVNIAFYKPFYHINTHFEPNWLYNLLTMPLLAVFGPAWADKVFMTGYVLGFGLGLRFLVSQINAQSKFISTVGLLFCYHNLLMMGFMNNSLSFVLWFWVVGWWWKKRDDVRTKTLLISASLWLLLYSAHPVGLTFAGLTVGAMLLGLLFFEIKNDGWATSRERFFQRCKSLLVSILPMLLLFAEFVFRRDWNQEKNLPKVGTALDGIGHLRALTTMHSTERDLALTTGLLCWLLFLGAVVWRWRAGKRQAADGLLLLVAMSFYLILYPPGSFSGGLELHLRLVMVPFLALLFWTATATFPVWAKSVAVLAALVLAVGFLLARWPVHRNASAYAQEVFSCNSHLADTATVLVLNYDWSGQTPQGDRIANRIWLFGHVDGYLGTTRSAILSDNYEANYAYFPTIARWQTNMYSQTDKDGINFDHRPPRADMLSYQRRTGQTLDYVLLLSYRDEFKEHDYTKEVFSQLDQAYIKIFTSEFGRAILYQRK